MFNPFSFRNKGEHWKHITSLSVELINLLQAAVFSNIKISQNYNVINFFVINNGSTRVKINMILISYIFGFRKSFLFYINTEAFKKKHTVA